MLELGVATLLAFLYVPSPSPSTVGWVAGDESKDSKQCKLDRIGIDVLRSLARFGSACSAWAGRELFMELWEDLGEDGR